MPSQIQRISADHPSLRIKDGVLQFSSALLDTPERIYDADLATITREEGNVMCFTFGKRSVNDRNRLRTRLQIRMGEDSLLKHFWLPSIKFRSLVRGFLKVEGALPPEHPETLQADADHSDWANVSNMAHSGQYAVIDFYELSPSALAKFNRSKENRGLELRSVVRIQLSARQLLVLLDTAETFVSDIKTRVQLDADELELEK